MLTKFRRLVLITAGTAALAVGPTISTAIADPVAPGQTAADPVQCANYQSWYDTDIDAATEAWLFGSTQTMNDWLNQADADKQLASDRGCDISGWGRTAVSSGHVSAAPVPVLKAR
jgi:hypothetical protein